MQINETLYISIKHFFASVKDYNPAEYQRSREACIRAIMLHQHAPDRKFAERRFDQLVEVLAVEVA
jgi:hypothetical protein